MSLAGYGIGERSKAGIKEKNGSDLATTANHQQGGVTVQGRNTQGRLMTSAPPSQGYTLAW